MRRLTFRTMGLALSIFETYGCLTCVGLVFLILLVIGAVVGGLLVCLFGVDFLLTLISDLLDAGAG